MAAPTYTDKLEKCGLALLRKIEVFLPFRAEPGATAALFAEAVKCDVGAVHLHLVNHP